MTGGKRVAFVLNPYKPDYHWYVYDEEKGVWGNKNGGKEATNKPLERDRENYGKDDITDYTKAAELLGYTTMLGEYYITRKNGRYLNEKNDKAYACFFINNNWSNCISEDK